MLHALHGEGFDDDQVLFTYRSFNSFLLGYLLLETGAMTVTDLKDGDGSFSADVHDAPDAANEPVAGGVSPTRSEDDAQAIIEADDAVERLDPQDDIEPARFPIIHRLARELAEEHFSEQFEHGLNDLLDRVATHVS